MTSASPSSVLSWRRLARVAAGCLAATALSSCGGGGSNPLGNPSSISNPSGAVGQQLSFIYYQRCINPIFLAQLPITHNGVTTTNTCAGSGCHDAVSGTGGAFRIAPGAAAVDLADPANTPAAVRSTAPMYKNFYSARGEVVNGSLTQSRLLAKPLLIGFQHGGGLIFENDQDANVKLIQYWITHPAPEGQDEFSAASNNMFTPPDPATGSCNTQ